MTFAYLLTSAAAVTVLAFAAWALISLFLDAMRRLR